MQIHNYNKDTFELIGTSYADESPLEPGVFLIPAYATTVEPPEFSSIKNKCFFREGEWVLEKIYTIVEQPLPDRYFRRGNLSYIYDTEAQTQTENYELIPFTADEMSIVKNGIWEQIKTIRDTRQLEGTKIVVGVEDYWFHTDIQSQIQHLGLYETAKNILNSSVSASMSDTLKLGDSDLIWKCMGDKMLTLTVQIVFDLIEADKKLMNDTFLNAEMLKIGLYASDDPIGFDITTGWPVKFGEL